MCLFPMSDTKSILGQPTVCNPTRSGGDMGSLLTIGVPLRNEAANIGRFLSSLVLATAHLPDGTEVELVLCLNGSTDNTERVVLGLRGALESAGLRVTILRSSEGKVAAQGQIARHRTFSGPICFLDADTVLDEFCLAALWHALNSNSSLRVAYAKVVPLFGLEPSAIQRLQMMHYRIRDLVYVRRYFHGRAFIVRSWDLPDYTTDDWQTELQRRLCTDRRYLGFHLERGPQIDDVFLSRYIIHQFGRDSVREVREATVSFAPPSSIRDFYAGHRRLWLEIFRLDKLFPEHR